MTRKPVTMASTSENLGLMIFGGLSLSFLFVAKFQMVRGNPTKTVIFLTI
ncbi:hypothetical protein LS684_09685 [Cytobacillus spongiae]|nr:hypothetical protein [Cytobacillus spongiae]UII57665.1 hypothetical protein LS684_09685 [Cytobacillus spongiae]